MEQNYWETDSPSAHQEIRRPLWNTTFHFLLHKSPTFLPAFCKINKVYTTSYHIVVKFHFKSFFLRSDVPAGICLEVFRLKFVVITSSLLRVPYAPLNPRFVHSSNSQEKVRIMKLFVVFIFLLLPPSYVRYAPHSHALLSYVRYAFQSPAPPFLCQIRFPESCSSVLSEIRSPKSCSSVLC